MRPLLTFNIYIWGVFIILIYIMMGFWKTSFFITHDLFYQSFSEQVDSESIDKFYSNYINNRWIGIVGIPLITILRVVYTSIALLLGDFFSDNQIGFKACFNISIKAEFAFLLLALTSLILIEFVWHIKTIDELSLVPFSLNHYWCNVNTPIWSKALLSYISLWELIYIILITNFLGFYNMKSWYSNLLFTITTYGIALLFWIILLTYLSITLT